MKANKPLIIMNGHICGHGESYYVAAHNKMDAARLMVSAEHLVHHPDTMIGADRMVHTPFEVNRMYRHINTMFRMDCWSNAMEGIPVERGVWYSPKDHENVRRII